MNWLDTSIGGAVGFVLSKVLDFFIKKEKSNQDGFEILQKAWKEEFRRQDDKIESIVKELGKREQKIEILESQISSMVKELETFSLSHPSIPLPLWLKSTEGVMLGLNDAYEKEFLFPMGKTKQDYLNKTDKEIWGEKIANTFSKNDKKAIAKDKKVEFIFETMTEGPLSNWVFIKYPQKIDDILVGIGGIAIPKPKDITILKR